MPNLDNNAMDERWVTRAKENMAYARRKAQNAAGSIHGTHDGKRLAFRDKCEKCGTPTNWTVTVMGRVGAYWCGCGN